MTIKFDARRGTFTDTDAMRQLDERDALIADFPPDPVLMCDCDVVAGPHTHAPYAYDRIVDGVHMVFGG